MENPKIDLIHINVYKSSINAPFMKKPLLSDDFLYHVEYNYHIDDKNDSIFLTFSVNIKNKSQINLGNFVLGYHFKIQNLSNYILKNEESGLVNLDEKLKVNLESISYSTTRGFVFGEIKGTLLHNAIMPINWMH